ncbi:hypothetical protein RJ641_022674 [Dillenia turbinata]|uniref:Uncharacterized protein n=1 Tax=Dillenia turbinata TaxID=194707 RepID=A0AAN8U9X4_9MAGN
MKESIKINQVKRLVFDLRIHGTPNGGTLLDGHKREEHGALIGEKLENTVKEMIPGELKNVEAGQNQPPETFQNIVRSEEMQKGTDSEAETVKIVNGDRVEASRGECFLESPPVATAASEETCKASANHQSDETTILAEENMVETESQQQKVAKTVAAVEGGKVETDNVDRDPQNSETVINNLDIKNVTEENKYVEKFAVMASEETISQEINNAEVDIHRELSKNDELLDLQRFLEKSETQKDKFEGYLDVISENAAAPTGGHEEDMKEDPTTDNTYAEKSSNFPEYMVDSQEEIEAGKVDNHGNSSELCPLHEEAAAEVKREKQNEVCEASGSTTAEEKPNEGTYEVQKGVESSLNHVPEYGLPRDEIDIKQNETEFEMLEKVSKMETEDRMVVKDPAENIDEAKTEEALNTGLQEITTKGEAELNCKDNSCKSENLIELNTVLNGEIYDKPIVMEAEGETKEHVKEAGYVEDVATGSTKIEKVKSTENEVEACNFKEEPFEEPEAAGMDKLTTIETIQDDRTLESTAVDTSLKHEDSLPPEVETLAPAEASKEENDQSRKQDIQHDEEEKEVLQEHQLGDKIERSIDVAYKDERTAPTEDVGEKISVTEEGDDVADRSNVNKENGSLEEDSKLPTEASEESNVTDTINMESTSKTDETQVEKVDGEYKLHEETCESKNVDDITEAETAKESSEANLLAETRCNDTERTDDEVPSNIRELDRVDELTEHRPEENEAIKETELSEDSTYKVASGEDYAEEQTVNVAASDLSTQSINEETVGIFHDNKNNAKELNVQVDDKLEPPSISEHVEEHILEEPDIKEIFTVQTEKKTVEEIYREHEMVAEANMPQQEVHAIPQTSEQEEEVEKHIEEKPTTLEENVTSVEEQTIPDSPEKEDKKPEIHEKDETARNITEENAITNIPSPPVAEETTKESLIEDETDKEVLHQEVKDLSVESIEQNLEPSETKSNTSKDTVEPNAAKEETTLTGIDENLVDKTLVSEMPREEKGEIFEPEPTVTDSNSASVDITTEETSMKECSKMMVDPVELEAEAEDLASIAASGVKVENEHADEQTENMIEEKETVIPTAGEHGIDEPAEKIEQQADEADQRDLVTGAKPLEGSVEGDTEEASAPEAKEHKLGTIEASEAIDGTPAEDETPLAHEEVEVDEDTLEIKEREMLETEKPSELQGTCENSDAEISKNQEALDIEIAENAEISRSLIEGSKGIEELGTSTNNKEADLKQEEPAGNFEESTKVIESNKAELDHNHDFESVNPGEKCQNACEPVSEKQWDNKQPETSETKLKEEKEHDAITEETMAQSTQECIKQECEEVEPKCEAEDHNNQTDDSIEITKTSKITEEGNNFECEEDSNTKAEESLLMRISDDQIAQKDDDSIVVVDALSSDAAELENTGNASTEEAKICAEKLETAPANEVLKELSSQEKDLEDEPTDNCSDAKVLHSITTETDLHNEESKTMKPEEISESVAVHSTTECENTVQKEELRELEVLKLGFEPTEEEKGTPEELSKEEDKPQEISSKPETEESVSQTVNADSLSEEPDTEPTRPTEYSLQETSKSEDILEVVNKYEEASDPDVQKNEEVIASEPPLQHEETLGTSEETEIKEENFQAATQPAAEKHLAKKHEEASSFELEKTKSTSRSMLGGQNDEALSSLEEAGDKEEHMAASDLIDEEHLKEEGREQSKEGFSLELQKTGKDLNAVPEVEEKDSLARPEEDETQAKSFDTAKPESIIEENLQAEIREKDEETSTLEFETTARDFESTAEVQSHEALSKSEVTSKQEQPDAAVTELPEKAPESAAKADSYEAFSVEAETLTNEEILRAPIAKQTAEETFYEQEGGNSIEASNEELDKKENSFESMQSMPEVASPEEHTESKTEGKKGQLNAATTQLPVVENVLEEQSKKLEEEPRTELEGTEQAFESEAQVLKKEKLSETEENETEAEIPGVEKIELPVERKILELVEKETELPVAHSCDTPKLAEESETNEETLTARTAEPTIEQNIHKSKETSNAEPEMTENAFESVPEVGSLREVSESETGGKVDKLTAATAQLQIKEYLPEEQGENLEEKSRMDLEEKPEQGIEVQKNENEILLETEENETKEEILGAAETELPVGKKLLELVEKVEEETSTYTKKETAAEYASEVKSPEAPTTADEIKEVHSPEAEEITTTKELLNAPNAEETIEENFPDGQGMKLDEATTNDLELEKTKKALESLPEVQSDQIPTELEGTEIKDEHLEVAAAELKAEENRCEKKIIVTEEIKREISSEKGMSETAASQDYHLVSPGEEIKETLHEDGSNAKGKFSETFIIATGTQNEALPQDLEAGKSEQRQGSVSCEDPVPDSDVPETVEEGAFIEAQHEHKVDDEEANKTDCNTQTKVTESEDMQSTRAGNKEDKIVDSVAPEKQLDQNIETHEESYDPSSPDTDSAGNLMDNEKLKYHKDATAERINQEYQEARYANPTTSCFVEPAQVETGKEEHIKAAAAELKIKEDEKAFELVHEVQSNEASSKSEESEAKLKILEDVTPESANKENLWDEVAEKHEEDSNAVFENTEASESILVVEPHEGVTDSEETKTREEHLQEAPAKLAIENLTEKQGQKQEEASPLELEKNEKALDSVSPDQKNQLVGKSEEGEAKKELVGATRESVVQENFPDVDRKQDETSDLEPEKTEKAPEPLPEEELIVARESQQASLDQDVTESCQVDELLREDEASKTLEATTGLTAESVHHEMTFTANEEVKQEILNEKVEHERVGDKDSQQAITIEDIKESLQADESLREDETKEDDPLGEDEATEKNHEAVTTDLAAEENLYEKTLTANDEVKNEISTELAVDNMAEKQCQTREEASNLELETSEKALDPVPADQKTEMVTRSEEDGTKKELIEAASKFSIQENFLDKDGMQDEAPKLEPEKTEKAPESGPEIQSHEPFCRSEEAEKGKMHLETETTELTGENFPGEQNEMSKEASKTELEITTRSLDFLPESQISDILTKSEDYEANEKDLDTATTDITAAKNEFERKIVGKKELKNEISTEEVKRMTPFDHYLVIPFDTYKSVTQKKVVQELVVAEESQQAFLDEIVKENCQEDGSLRQNEAKATITTKVSVGEEIKDSYQEAVEKNLEAVSTDLTAEENRCDKTSTATEEPKNKISNEEVLQEKVDVEDSHQVSTGEDIKDSPQEDEPSPANYPGDKINIASIITETETQVEQLAQHCEDGASQKAQRPGSNETLHIVSNRNDTDEESILQEAALEMKLNEMATEVDVEGQNGKPSTAETDTGPSIPSKEKKVPELVVLKHEWEPKESIDSEEIKKSKNEEEVNKMLSSPPTTCVTSEEPLPVKEGGKGEDASESLVSEMPPGESHKNDDRLKQFEANSARNNSNVQSDQKEQMLCTRELESSWLTETIQKGEPSKGDEISKTEKENLFLEEHIDAKVVPSEEEESIKNEEEPNKSKVQAGAFTRATERKPDEDEIYSTLQDKKEEFGLLPHTLDSCADTSQKEGAVNLGEAYEIINNIQPPTKPSKAIPEEKISISIASDKNLETMVTTGNRDFPLVQEEPIAETARAYPPELQQGTCDEIKTGDENEETAKASIPEPSAHTSLFDLMERSIREHPHGTRELTDEKGQIVHEEEMYRNEAEKIHVEEPLTDEERECEEDEEEHKKADSGSDAPVMVEAHRDMDEKATHKKHHNILSGVGSKVKHSIAKVKKAITGKSSHHKQLSPK